MDRQRDSRSEAPRAAAAALAPSAGPTVRAAELGAWEWDIVADAIHWSDESHRFFERPPGTIQGSYAQCLAAVHPEDRERVNAAMQATLAADGALSVEFRVPRGDGSVRWLVCRGRLLRDEAGRPKSLVGVAMDVTRHVEVEQALRESEQRFRSLVEATSDWVWEVDEQARYVYVSPKVREVLGYRPVEVLGKRPFEFMDAEDAARVADSFAHTVRARRPFHGRERVSVHRDGRKVVLESSGVPVFDAAGAFKGYRGIDRDVTERVRALEALRASEALRRQIIEAEPECVKLLDRQGRLLEMNPAGLRMIEADSLDQVVGHCVYPMVDEEQRAAFKALNEGAFLGRGGQMEFGMVGLRGTRRWMEVHILPLAGQGPISAALAISRDLTAQRRAQEDARERLVELAHLERLSTMGEALAQLTHEINQPLHAIANFAEACDRLMASSPQAPGEAIQCVRQISQQALRAGAVLSRVGQFVRKSPFCPERVAPNDVVEGSSALVAVELRRAGAQLRLRLAEGLPAVQCDRVQVEQVLVNLLKNACEALEATPPAQRWIALETAAEGEAAVRITVADNGCGVPPEHLPRLFESFFTTREDGSGMGLAISRSIVEAHGGRIWAEPDAARGVRFHFTLPAAAGGN
jgi:PAS domain S-box-containing protein